MLQQLTAVVLHAAGVSEHLSMWSNERIHICVHDNSMPHIPSGAGLSYCCPPAPLVLLPHLLGAATAPPDLLTPCGGFCCLPAPLQQLFPTSRMLSGMVVYSMAARCQRGPGVPRPAECAATNHDFIRQPPEARGGGGAYSCTTTHTKIEHLGIDRAVS